MGSHLIVDGARIYARGLHVISWMEDPRLRLRSPEDCRPRLVGTWIRYIVVHTTKGLTPQPIIAGYGPAVEAGLRCSRYWANDGRNASAHLVVDHDGVVAQTADVVRTVAYGCPSWNADGVHIEIYQGGNGELYEEQLQATVLLVDVLTAALGIQRQVPHQYTGTIPRWERGDETVVGVIGHRDAARNRGAGDPGNAIFNRLGLAGYEAWDFALPNSTEGSRTVWRQRQRELGLAPDGIPGKKTVAALRDSGRHHGLWVPRPGDGKILAVDPPLVS